MSNRTCLGDPEFTASTGKDDISVSCYVDLERVNVSVENYRGSFFGCEQCTFILNEEQTRELRDVLNDFLELRAARVQQG